MNTSGQKRCSVLIVDDNEELLSFLSGCMTDYYEVPITTIASNPTDTDFVKRITELIENNFDNTDLSPDFLAHEYLYYFNQAYQDYHYHLPYHNLSLNDKD